MKKSSAAVTQMKKSRPFQAERKYAFSAARAENRRKGRLSALRAHTKAP
jgi:hypothetical protein